MKITQTMERYTDGAGWAIFAATLGLVTALPWLAQLATGLLTMAVGIVVAHFLKRELNRHWPQQPRRRKRKPAQATE